MANWKTNAILSLPQQTLMNKLVDLKEEILNRKTPLNTLNRFFRKEYCGVYIWGNVGSGKTTIMDWFIESIPTQLWRRYHFNEFMLTVQEEMIHNNSIERYLKRNFKENGIKLLSLDEFQISDIANAMILRQLLEQLSKHAIKIVTTSNSAPQDIDYRMLGRTKPFSNFYNDLTHFEKDGNNEMIDFSWFESTIGTKEIETLLQNKKVLLVKNVIPLNQIEDRNTSQRFVTFIDIVYDKKIKIKIHSEFPVDEFIKTSPQDVFQRTVSRFNELLRDE